MVCMPAIFVSGRINLRDCEPSGGYRLVVHACHPDGPSCNKWAFAADGRS